MNRLIVYADYKHDDPEEYLNVNLDTELNDLSKDILYNYLDDFLNKTFDLTYVNTGDAYKLTKREFDHMLTKKEYFLGYIDDTYLFPTAITIKILKDETVSLKQLMLQ
jgi:hypothetical protein